MVSYADDPGPQGVQIENGVDDSTRLYHEEVKYDRTLFRVTKKLSTIGLHSGSHLRIGNVVCQVSVGPDIGSHMIKYVM